MNFLWLSRFNELALRKTRFFKRGIRDSLAGRWPLKSSPFWTAFTLFQVIEIVVEIDAEIMRFGVDP